MTLDEKLYFLQQEVVQSTPETVYERVQKHLPDIHAEIHKRQLQNKIDLIRVQTETVFILMEEHYIHGVPMETIRDIYIEGHNSKNMPFTNKYALYFMGITV